MNYINKRTVANALKTLGVMMVIIMLVLFIGVVSLSDDSTFSWILFFGFLIIYFFAAFVDGTIRGEDECRYGVRIKNQEIKTGKPLDDDEKMRMYSKKKGLYVAAMIGLPGFILFLLSAITGDNVLAIRALTRFYFIAYAKLFTEESAVFMTYLYFACSVIYPALYYLGYLNGPRQHKRVQEIIVKNDEDYKRGIRKRRTGKKRGFFSR